MNDNATICCIILLSKTKSVNTKKIQDYIQNQLKKDEISEQLTLDLEDPFKGSK